MSQQLDPEELSRLIRPYQDACVGAIARFEDHVAQYLGDGMLADFGYPLALEGGAERAIRAGLAVIERMHASRLNAPLNIAYVHQLATFGHLARWDGAAAGSGESVVIISRNRPAVENDARIMAHP